MSHIEYNTEAEVERRLIDVLGEGHNQWTFRPDIKSEAALWDNLRMKITQNNLSEIGETPLTDDEFDRIKTELLLRTQTPFDAARWLKGENGIARVHIDRDDVTLGSISLILYSNQDIGGGISSYEVVHQVAKAKVEDGRNHRFDVTLLINGLPIIQIELKQVNAKDGVYQAFNQIKKYAGDGHFRNNIFSTLQLFVISNEKTTRYFANALPDKMHKKFVFSWRTSDNRRVEDLYEFSKQVLNIPDAHRLIAYYTIVSEDQDNKQLMVLHPYQIHAIEAISRAVSERKSGYIWHATGSGKTLTSFVATKLMARKPGVDRTIMLVDRKDLDNQTTSEFTKFASEFNTGASSGNAKANTLIVGTDSSRQLARTLMSDVNNNTVVITTRQKLEAALRHAEREEKRKGSHRFEKLLGQHLVFVVDECHRAVSSEGMNAIKKFFPKSTWYGFTGTPIFDVNKKEAKGNLARTTFDQYGDRLHTYTIKNALDDKAVLGFQVEHEDTLGLTSMRNLAYRELHMKSKFKNYSNDELNRYIDSLEPLELEEYVEFKDYEKEEHIYSVLRKIFRPDNAYIKFDFQNGKPTKSAIFTTNSIAMAKQYYRALKEMSKNPNWMEEEYKDHPIREGRTIEDLEFPRFAITYSLDENVEDASSAQEEMKEVIDDYNAMYDTSWSVETLDRYNGDINNRLARKKGEYRQFGNHLDLVIVVDRLLTGFDAPQVQTLFVDRNLTYAGLIQAFSRTNRTFPNKTKGHIVTFRKPATMELNVKEATILYSDDVRDTNLIYPNYAESKKAFEQASIEFKKIVNSNLEICEDSSLDLQVDYMKAFQNLNNSYEALVTYDEYNDEYEQSEELQNDVNILQENIGVYNTIKGSLPIIINSPKGIVEGVDVSEIEFFGNDIVKTYDIDAAYINQLLGTYDAGNETIRDDIERALQKMNKPDIVRDVYRSILNDIDTGAIPKDEDIFSIKRYYFNQRRNQIIEDFANEWCVREGQLHNSAVQYRVKMGDVPNSSGIMKSADYQSYKDKNAGANMIEYMGGITPRWEQILLNQVLPLDNELK